MASFRTPRLGGTQLPVMSGYSIVVSVLISHPMSPRVDRPPQAGDRGIEPPRPGADRVYIITRFSDLHKSAPMSWATKNARHPWDSGRVLCGCLALSARCGILFSG